MDSPASYWLDFLANLYPDILPYIKEIDSDENNLLVKAISIDGVKYLQQEIFKNGLGIYYNEDFFERYRNLDNTQNCMSILEGFINITQMKRALPSNISIEYISTEEGVNITAGKNSIDSDFMELHYFPDIKDLLSSPRKLAEAFIANNKMEKTSYLVNNNYIEYISYDRTLSCIIINCKMLWSLVKEELQALCISIPDFLQNIHELSKTVPYLFI